MSSDHTREDTYRDEALMQQAREIDYLKGQRFEILNGEGYIEFIDVMGSDFRILDAARTTSQVEDKYDEQKDRNLVRYLMRHRHTTPFEFCEVCILIKIPMDHWRQFVRHRTANINEYSTRYSEAIDDMATTLPGQWRLQAKTNRQGSSGDYVTEYPQKMRDALTVGGHSAKELIPPGEHLSNREKELQDMARETYLERLEYGVAKEQARKDLPLSNFTLAYWKIDLHNLFHFLSLRMDSHAQAEIREYANCIGQDIVRRLFPWCWEAFVDYRLESMFLTRKDVQVIYEYLSAMRMDNAFEPLAEEEYRDGHDHPDWQELTQCRERTECMAKLQRLGILEDTDEC
jgi:thymidylate synthase (FAD)